MSEKAVGTLTGVVGFRKVQRREMLLLPRSLESSSKEKLQKESDP
jgi:hypothetical protein